MATKPVKKEGNNGGGGKLNKNNTISISNLKPQCNYEGWATKQGGSHKSWKRRYFVLVPALSNAKQAAELYYFKSDKAKSATGVIRINERSTIKESNVKGKNCIAIDTGMIGTRTYYMYCGSPQEQDKFMKAVGDKLAALKQKPADAAKPANPQPSNGGATPGAGMGAAGAKETANDGIKFALESAKNAIPFLGTDGGEDRILEFWQIWTESIPTNAPEVSVTLVMTSDMSQLSWRVCGPQNVLIQEMVDFFWNVGAPEQEIDRLNDVGGLINPLTIGSWIDMSTKGGMDGGWVFPVTVNMVDALKACDEGKPLTQLSEWTRAQRIEECVTVGRDMGASPPRQTEVRFPITGDNFDTRLSIAMGACRELSVSTSSEGFVRIGMILPDPDRNTVANSQGLFNFQTIKVEIERPAYAEFQFHMESFGYGVYSEGLSIVFHFNLDPHMV